MNVLLLLTTAGADTGPFDLYENSTGTFLLFESDVQKNDLTDPLGYSTIVPSGTTQVRITSTGICDNYIDVVLMGTTTTTTTTVLYYTLNGCSESDPPYSTTIPPILVNQRYVLTVPSISYYVWNNNPGTSSPLVTHNPSIQIVSGQSGCP